MAIRILTYDLEEKKPTEATMEGSMRCSGIVLGASLRTLLMRLYFGSDTIALIFTAARKNR
jgi:hypothetical protein